MCNGLVESLGTGMERKAITEEDVQTWKRRRLRGAKSAESLLVLPQSSSIDSTKRMSRLVDENMLMKMFQGKVKSSYCVYKASYCVYFEGDAHSYAFKELSRFFNFTESRTVRMKIIASLCIF